MRIIECYINSFGCYNDKRFVFNAGLNSFFLKNGEGKTTLAAFIKAMLYSLEKSGVRSYERRRYRSYSGGVYGGSLKLMLNDTIYRIERTFGDTQVKDTLKIYDENGKELDTFLGTKVSSLQKDSSSFLGDIILGVDKNAFLKSSFISSEDLDFESSESIKMKISNIVIDKECENSFEDTLKAIVDFDLREKKPTQKNENAYPYQIEMLERSNKDTLNEINELVKLEASLEVLYQNREDVKKCISKIDDKQNTFKQMHVLKGKMTTVDNYNQDILDKDNIINTIINKYNGKIPSALEISRLEELIKEYNSYSSIDKGIVVDAADFNRFKALNGNVIADDDYELLLKSYNKINTLKPVGVVDVDYKLYEELNNRFKNKVIKDEVELDDDYISYNYNLKKLDAMPYEEYATTNYPTEAVLNHIESEIASYHELEKKRDEYTKNGIKLTFVKVLLIIITLGFYLIAFNKQKKTFKENLRKKDELINSKLNELDDFFLKYNKANGSLELRLLELKDDISKYEANMKKNYEYNQTRDLVELKKKTLANYFLTFGYTEDISLCYQKYKKDLKEYERLEEDIKRNDLINMKVSDSINEEYKNIDAILLNYHMIRNDDVNVILKKLKDDLDFYKRLKPILASKALNVKRMKETEDSIKTILTIYGVNLDSGVLLAGEMLISDYNDCLKAKEDKVEIALKKESFIKENKLDSFISNNVDSDELALRRLRETKSIELDSLEDNINAIELKLSFRDSLLERINKNNELIAEYKEKVKIAQYAADALKTAHNEMEAKFIGPIKDTFINYAKRIYEKIASNVTMNYDYEIKYDIKGSLRDAKDLSDGERTIMILALRLAVLDSMYKNHDSIIILDDPFESLDSDKLIKAKELIKDLANDWQILYFTCHESRII